MHSWSHPLLTHCSDESLLEELLRSRQEIEQRLGKQVEALRSPGGQVGLTSLTGARRWIIGVFSFPTRGKPRESWEVWTLWETHY